MPSISSAKRSDVASALVQEALQQAQERDPLEPVVDRKRMVEIETDPADGVHLAAFDAARLALRLSADPDR